MRKVVGVILGARYCRVKFVQVVSSTVIGWVWQVTLQSAQRHNQISKIGDILEKIRTVFEQIFSQKPLVAPRAVEINIFADLTISKRQKCLDPDSLSEKT